MDPATLFVYALAGLYGLDKVVAALGRLGKLPPALSKWDRARAERLVAEETREEKLDRIISEFETDHGASLRDAIDRIEKSLVGLDNKLEEHLAEQPPLIDEHRALMDRVARLEGGRMA